MRSYAASIAARIDLSDGDPVERPCAGILHQQYTNTALLKTVKGRNPIGDYFTIAVSEDYYRLLRTL